MELRKRHKAHARPLKNLEERFVWYARAIEMDACDRKGTWIEDHCPNARELHLDLGCGKGQFAAEMARLHPDILFVGLDFDKTCIARAAQKAYELELENCIFALADGEDLTDYFADGELSRMYLNFSTPHPRKKHAAERLTHVDQLIAYRSLLAEHGTIDMKTDSPPFFDFSLIQFDLAGYDIEWMTRDLHGSPQVPGGEAPQRSALTDFSSFPVTEYEERLCALGAKVHACRAVKADRPCSNEQTAELSLFEYLPEDLSTLEYVPYGMEGYVFNMKHHRAKALAKQDP